MNAPVTTPVPAIDIHTHLFPERLQAAVRRALGDLYGWSFDLPDDPETFAAYVRARGTERFCILPYAHKPGMARALNAWTHETADALDAIAFACIHPEDPLDVLDEAFAAGARGLKLHHQVQNVAPDDPALFPVYEWMLEHDHPLLVHAGAGPTDNGLVGAERFHRMMRRFPDLRICVAHMGGPEIDAFLDMLDEFPRLHLDTCGLRDIPVPARIAAHPDRIMFGTDAPNIVEPYDVAITRITDLGLGPEVERMIFRDNARAFLRL